MAQGKSKEDAGEEGRETPLWKALLGPLWEGRFPADTRVGSPAPRAARLEDRASEALAIGQPAPPPEGLTAGSGPLTHLG